MNRSWLIFILSLSCLLLMILKSHELCALKPFFKAERSLKLKHFQQAKRDLSLKDQELLELWESMLSGRSAPVSKLMKEDFKLLGLNHLFTPSGFHLSAVLSPLTKLINGKNWQLALLVGIGVLLSFAPGMAALKRMVLIKSGQKLLSLKTGFVCALLVDCLFGSFQYQALSFTYSFLFLGIIYSGVKGFGLVLWFFLAQIMLAYFQGTFISPLLLVFSPFLNFAFGLAMPLLFVLAFPLWQWQLELGLFLLQGLEQMVRLAAGLVSILPSLEINIAALGIIFLFQMRLKRAPLIFLLFFCQSLNLDLSREPGLGTYEFVPNGEIIKIISRPESEMVYFSDGKCERKLVRGIWWEKCSPRLSRGSRKKLKKLSYPSSGPRKSSLRG